MVALPFAVSAALDRWGARVREVTLFGSYARGEATEDSDVDVLVVIDDLSDIERGEVFDLASRVDRAQQDWVGLSPLSYSSSHVTKLRAGGRRLWIDIARDGVQR